MTAPIYRAVEAHTGAVSAASVIRDIDALISERAANTAAYAAAVGFYDCPCGSAFEFTDTMGLEDYAALNRWLGEHFGKCTINNLFPSNVDQDRLIRERDDARAERDNMVNLTLEVGRLDDYLRHAIADRDDYREQAAEWSDKYHAAQVRMDEMAEELRELRHAS